VSASKPLLFVSGRLAKFSWEEENNFKLSTSYPLSALLFMLEITQRKRDDNNLSLKRIIVSSPRKSSERNKKCVIGTLRQVYKMNARESDTSGSHGGVYEDDLSFEMLRRVVS
jgi:hypothetical protein